jgi:hypothetical protein
MLMYSEWFVDLQNRTVRNANGLAVHFCHDDDLSVDFEDCGSSLPAEGDLPSVEGWRPRVLAMVDGVSAEALRQMVRDALKVLLHHAFMPAMA